MARKNKNNNKKNHGKFLLPASKLPVGEPIKDFRETVQWRIFKIIAEFVDGFNFLADIKKSVTFFGSARIKPEAPSYQKARKLGFMLAKNGYDIITVGGPRIMEAANRALPRPKEIQSVLI